MSLSPSIPGTLPFPPNLGLRTLLHPYSLRSFFRLVPFRAVGRLLVSFSCHLFLFSDTLLRA